MKSPNKMREEERKAGPVAGSQLHDFSKDASGSLGPVPKRVSMAEKVRVAAPSELD